MKAFKGMDKNMRCRDFQFEQGKTYETDGPIKVCDNGFHACKRPLDVFAYYPPASSRYFEVEQGGEISEACDDSKIASSQIKIGAEIGIPGLIRAHVEYVKAHTAEEHTDPKQATAGSYGAATAGDSGAATAGSYGAATAGSYGAATAGFRGAATSRGSSAVGAEGIACARGNGCRVKGGLGAVLVIAEEKTDSFAIAAWKAVVVDGETVKADTWYMLKDGELVEVEGAQDAES